MVRTKSQIKKSRAWMTRMQNLTMARKDGTRFKAPMFSHVWTLTTKQETNDRGSWFGYFIEGEPVQRQKRKGKEEGA